MILAPAIGCSFVSTASRSSAGRQLEQRSDVNSSRSTGTGDAPGSWAAGCAAGTKRPMTEARRTATSAHTVLAILRLTLLGRCWRRLVRLDIDLDHDLIAHDGRGFDHAV